MEVKNSALRVFWKSKKRNSRKSTFDSDEQIVFPGKHFKRKKRPSRDPEDHTEQTCDPVITFPCSICKHEIDLPSIFLHKKQHAALVALDLKWKGRNKPKLSVIANQRQLIITKLLSSYTFTAKVLLNINNAFELLWKKKIPAYYKITDNIHSSSMYSQKIYHLLIKGVAICNDRNSTWKVDMNDKFTVVNNFGNKPNVCFFGLFDGHYGPSAANFTSMEFPVLLLHQLSRFDPSYQMTPEEQILISSFDTVFREEYRAIENVFSKKKRTKESRSQHENIHKAFAKAFWRMDRLLRLGRQEVSRVRWSGCSAVTCILEGKMKSPYAKRNKKRITESDGQAEDDIPSQGMPQIISGELHVANTGNVQAVLCRNGKGFSLTKEHTTRNINERRRVLQTGAMISSNEPHGLLEGQIKTTRGLGFHGDSKLKKFIIPVPQTISVPIDDLCQFFILATNGLWEVLDKKEVTAMAITMFQVYKETSYPIIQNKSSPSEDPLPLPICEQSGTNSDNIHTLFQCRFESVASTHSKESMSEPKNVQTLLPETTNHDPCSEEETDRRADGVPKNSSKEEKISTKSFYEGAAEYISHELVNAALMAGSRDNITVMVILLSGSEDQFLK